MATEISLGDQFVCVSNQRLSALVAFAITVGAEKASSDIERSWVEKLRSFEEQAWPGIPFNLDERFPDVVEKKFWARVYHDVARRIFLRQLGNQEATFWQSSAIGDAYITARILTRAVQETGEAWSPETENTKEGEGYNSGQVKVRV